MKRDLGRVQAVLHRDQPCTFLWEARRLAAVGPRLHGVEVRAPGDPLAWLGTAWVDAPGGTARGPRPPSGDAAGIADAAR